MAPETPKGVSSRLLTMKFMQRAAASGSSSGTPDSSAQSSKKRKLDDSTNSGRLSMNFDQAAVQAAINEQQATRQAALDRHVTGDTHWVLNTPFDSKKPAESASAPLKIKYIGYGDIDSGDESADQEDGTDIGRTSTSNYKQAKSKKQKTDAAEAIGHEDAESNSDESDAEASPAKSSKASDSQRSSRNESRSRSQSRHRSESAKAKELRDKRKKKDVPLNKITSISSGGNKNFSPSSGKGGVRGGRK